MTAAVPESPLQQGGCRIDRWSAGGWQPVADGVERAKASAALARLREREPDAWFRIVRRNDDGDSLVERDRPVAPKILVAEGRAVVSGRTDGRAGAAARRIAGGVGLAGLLALVLCAAWVPLWAPSEPLSRSAAVADGGSDGTGDNAAAGAIADAAEVPAALAGRWAAPETGCTGGDIQFLSDNEVRTDPGGDRRILPVDGYYPEADGLLRLAYAGGASVTYAVHPGRLSIRHARIGGIEITPQRPLELLRCPGTPASPRNEAATVVAQLQNSPQAAFRLAVEGHDDLAAALAIARGLPVSAPLTSGTGPTPLELAVIQGRTVLVGKLVAAGADPNQAGIDGTPLLIRATRRQDVATVEALLAAGADPRRPGPEGASALEEAAALNHQLLVDILFAAR